MQEKEKEGIRRIRLVIDSSMAHVSLVGMAINKLCSKARFSDMESFQIELCVVEAVNNSIEHAYGHEPGHEVEVIFSISSDELVLDICDTGRPMDPALFEEKNLSSLSFNADDPESIPERGRGIAIIKEIMYNTSYTSREGRNCFIMKKKLPSSS